MDGGNIINVVTDDDAAAFLKGRQARNAIGNALGRAYPTHPWLVDVDVVGGIASVRCPEISSEYGMVIHLTHDTATMEQKAVRFAGELLERFRVSRVRAAFDHLNRNVRGDVVTAAKGEG